MGKLIRKLIIIFLILIILFYISLLFEFNLLKISVFIVPIAGILVGGLYGFAAFLSTDENFKYGKKMVVVIAILSVFTIAFMTCIDYLTCFVSGGNTINHLFQGEHISGYEVDGIPMDLIGYLQVYYFDASFRSKGAIFTIQDETFGLIIYLMQYLTTLIASIYTTELGVSNIAEKRDNKEKKIKNNKALSFKKSDSRSSNEVSYKETNEKPLNSVLSERKEDELKDSNEIFYCHKCGHKLRSDAVFCDKCGTRIR